MKEENGPALDIVIVGALVLDSTIVSVVSMMVAANGEVGARVDGLVTPVIITVPTTLMVWLIWMMMTCV